jgi:hypothetical protein
MYTTFLLPSLPSILSKMNSNLEILQDLVFQLNTDFISNLNFNPFGLLLHPYISLGSPPTRLSMPISPQNQTLAATQVPSRCRCLSPPPPLFQSLPFKLNIVPIMRSQGPNHRGKNHIKTRSVASAIYCQSIAVIFRRGCDFSGEPEVNLTSLVSFPCHTFTPGLYRSEIRGLWLKL